MAQVTITITDKENGKVELVSTPSFEQMAKMEISGTGLSSAHGYALLMMHAVREESKRQGPVLAALPRVGR